MKGRYAPEPINRHDALDDQIRRSVGEYLGSQSLIGTLVPDSIPHDAVVRPLVTDLPVEAHDGDEVRYVADSDDGVIWLLRYRANAPSAYRWEFLGGSPLYAYVEALETTTSTTYTESGFTSMTLSLPHAGTYDVAIGAKANNNTDTRGTMMSYDIGSTAADDNDSIETFQTGATSVSATNYRHSRKTITAPSVLTVKYRATTGGTAAFWERSISATPVRVGRSN